MGHKHKVKKVYLQLGNSFLFIFALLFSIKSTLAQSNNFEPDRAKYLKGKVYERNIDKKRTFWYVPIKDNIKQLNISIGYPEYIKVFYDEELIYSDSSQHLSNTYDFFVPFNAKKGNGKVEIYLTKKKVFLSFRLKKKYKFVSLYYFYPKTNEWIIRYTNNAPSE